MTTTKQQPKQPDLDRLKQSLQDSLDAVEKWKREQVGSDEQVHAPADESHLLLVTQADEDWWDARESYSAATLGTFDADGRVRS